MPPPYSSIAGWGPTFSRKGGTTGTNLRRRKQRAMRNTCAPDREQIPRQESAGRANLPTTKQGNSPYKISSGDPTTGIPIPQIPRNRGIDDDINGIEHVDVQPIVVRRNSDCVLCHLRVRCQRNKVQGLSDRRPDTGLLSARQSTCATSRNGYEEIGGYLSQGWRQMKEVSYTK